MRFRESLTLEQLRVRMQVPDEAHVYDYIEEIGRELPLLPASLRVAENEVARQVWWVDCEGEPRGDAVGRLERGLVRIVLVAHQGPPERWLPVETLITQLRLEVVKPGQLVLFRTLVERRRATGG